MKLILLCLFLVLLTNLFAADNVRITSPTNLQVYGTTNATATSTFLLGSVNPSDGNGLSEAAAAFIYIPISNTADATHDFYFSRYHEGYRLFDISDATYSYISFPLTLNVSSTHYLYAAVYNGTNYVIVRKSAPTAYSTATITTFNLLLKDICAVNTTACTNLAVGSATLVSGQVAKVYFFISTNSAHADNDPVVLTTAGDGDGGVFFQVKLSNKVYKSIDSSISLSTPLTKGDGRVIANYTVTNPISSDAFDHVAVFMHAKAASVAALPVDPAPHLAVGDPALYIGIYPDAQLIDYSYSTSQSDPAITINSFGYGKPAINGTSYLLSIGLMDKYKFVTNLSNAGVGTPTQIQELLKKQACYLLTAGFGEEHYIINYFRSYRDHILANSWLGRKFIKVYYRSAPHYAMIIYKSEWMRFVIRSAAYTLYFLFNFYWVVLIFLGACLFLNLWKIKILLHNNRL
ncbi:MAG: hypothetical protein H7281_02130 [Bacteriovorax sp.]|nr:hypothetical protein [Bacteriovorax sp.]